MSNDFYTYELAYPESMGGVVFYVGKGRGYRWLDHERQARQGVQSRKCDVIRSIWARAEQVHRRKVQEHLSEEQALFSEAYLTSFYGWTNLTNEQRGCCSLLPLEEQPISRKGMEQYALTWQGNNGTVIRVEARKNYCRIHLNGYFVKQVYSVDDIEDVVGKENITLEQKRVLFAKQGKFYADYPPSRRHQKTLAV